MFAKREALAAGSQAMAAFGPRTDRILGKPQ